MTHGIRKEDPLNDQIHQEIFVLSLCVVTPILFYTSYNSWDVNSPLRDVQIQRFSVMLAGVITDRWLCDGIIEQFFCLPCPINMWEISSLASGTMWTHSGSDRGLDTRDNGSRSSSLLMVRSDTWVQGASCRRFYFEEAGWVRPLPFPILSPSPQLGAVYFTEMDWCIPPATGHYTQAPISFPWVSLTQQKKTTSLSFFITVDKHHSLDVAENRTLNGF